MNNIMNIGGLHTTHVSISTHVYVHRKQTLEIGWKPDRNLFHVEEIRRRKRLLVGSRAAFSGNHHKGENRGGAGKWEKMRRTDIDKGP